MLESIKLAANKITAKLAETKETNYEKAKDAFLTKALAILESTTPDRFSRFICHPTVDGNYATCLLADWARPGREYTFEIVDNDILIDGGYHVAWLPHRNRIFNLISKEVPYWPTSKKSKEEIEE